jgi:hypothetical protein
MKRPGQRFMTIQDGKGLILKVFGGYSPKVFDAHFMNHNKQFLEEEMKGAVMLGDEHFRTTSQYFDGPKIVTNVPEKKKAEKKKKSGKKRKRDEEDESDEEDYDFDYSETTEKITTLPERSCVIGLVIGNILLLLIFFSSFKAF